MNIRFIYLSTSCTKSLFDRLQHEGVNRDVPQAQKYHRLLIEGLSKNRNTSVTAISLIPTNRQWSKKVLFTRDEERVNENLKYIYLPFVNIPIIKQLLLKHSVNKELLREIRSSRDEDTVLVCDIWNQTLSKCARSIGKKMGIKVVGIVTDVPMHRSNAYKSKNISIQTIIKDYVERKTYKSAKKYDYYLLLTLAMNDVVNPNRMPYIVLEGHSDLEMKEVPNTLDEKKHPKVMLYAGTLHREYGIEMLVKAFISCNFSDWELHIYGKGNYERELEHIIASKTNVKYFGLASNEIIINEQIHASLIVNPRPTSADYVKYSFPSKTLEAMASGTPLLTTRLPGMPDEYMDYVYLFESETEEGYSNVLKHVLGISATEMHEKGIKAKQFAISKKNNMAQAKKVIDMLSSDR